MFLIYARPGEDTSRHFSILFPALIPTDSNSSPPAPTSSQIFCPLTLLPLTTPHAIFLQDFSKVVQRERRALDLNPSHRPYHPWGLG